MTYVFPDQRFSFDLTETSTRSLLVPMTLQLTTVCLMLFNAKQGETEDVRRGVGHIPNTSIKSPNDKSERKFTVQLYRLLLDLL